MDRAQLGSIAGVGGGSWAPTCRGWRREERGWWVREGVGGIVREEDRRWYFYPADDGPRRGPWRTLTYAMDALSTPHAQPSVSPPNPDASELSDLRLPEGGRRDG